MADPNLDGEKLIPTTEFNALLRTEAKHLPHYLPRLTGANPRLVLSLVLQETDAAGRRKRFVGCVRPLPEGNDIAMFRTGLDVFKTGTKVAAAFLFRETPGGQESVILTGRTIDGRSAAAKVPLVRGEQTSALGEWKFADTADKVQDKPLALFFLGYAFLPAVAEQFLNNPEGRPSTGG